MGNYKYSINKSILFTEIENESVIVNTSKGIIISINDVGTKIFKILQTGSYSTLELHNILKKEYDVCDDKLNKDLKNFLSQLIINDLVEISNIQQ
jgi:hypothetical protein